MTFNSFSFLLLFLPAVLLVFYFIGWSQRRAYVIFWLVGVSVVFYGYWHWILTGILLVSVLTNYAFGRLLRNHQANKVNAKNILCLGIFCNLGVLVLFKYFGFYGGQQPQVFMSVSQSDVVVPIALSFLTFQQTIYLVEIFRNKVNEKNFWNYFLYIIFFPQLLNGPIVRPNVFFHQLENKKLFKFQANQLAAGLTIFSCGLFKKVVLADGIARYSKSAFDSVAQGAVLSFEEAWSGALSFSLQVYFDFSGYSDMAVGLGYMFGIRLPANFNSPYKATSLIEFWRRWNMTLSSFVKDYMYVPLGGKRKGFLKQTINIFLIMLVGGIWHGTGATFVVWGSLHGIFLAINHFWRKLRDLLGYSLERKNFLYEILSCIFTFLVVTVLWVLFRAENLDVALSIIRSLFGFHASLGADFNNIKINEDRLGFLLFIIWFTPNMTKIMSRYYESENIFGTQYNSISRWYHWYPNIWFAAFTAILFIMSLLELTQTKEFIYFQF